MKNRFSFHHFKWPLNPPLKKMEEDLAKFSKSLGTDKSGLLPKKKKTLSSPANGEKTNKRRARVTFKGQHRFPPTGLKGPRFNFPEK
jgi:hypothetical protein